MARVEQELNALRAAASRRDWNECRALTEALLQRLSAAEVLQLARLQVEGRLTAFERQQPGIAWPRVRLEALKSEVSASQAVPGTSRELEEAREAEFAGPGANSFIKALQALWDAAAEESLQRRAALATEAIAEAIMAGMVEHWGARHIDQWNRWYTEALSDAGPSEPDLLLRMMNDSEVAALDIQGWQDLADALAARLQG